MLTAADLSASPPLLRDFLTYIMTIKGRSERTAEAYYIDLRLFLRYIYAARMGLSMDEPNLANIPINGVTSEMICSVTLSDVYAFLNFVQTVNANNAKTRSRKVSSIRSFYKYIHIKTNLLAENPMDNLEVPSARKSMPKYLTLEESVELLGAVGGAQRERDYCILTLLLNCGMRLSELVNIKLESIRENTLVLLGKGNKERMIYLNNACLLAIEEYLSVRKQPVNDKHKHYLLLTTRGTPLTPRRVEQIVEENLMKAGLSGRGYSPHKLRHTAATLMYQHGGVDIRVLKEILGHANLGTTEIYTHVASNQLESAMDSSPLAGIKPPEHRTAPEEEASDNGAEKDK